MKKKTNKWIVSEHKLLYAHPKYKNSTLYSLLALALVGLTIYLIYIN